MIYFNFNKFSSVYFSKQAISAVYKGASLVWEAIKSCFGAGYWKNDASWSNDDAWIN